ncbi:MAG: divalent-cation tolerance protein CutA [Pseudomonadota bacterium]
MPLAVFTTIHTEEGAEALARAAVEQRLAACVHIEEIRSVFRWEGAVQDEPEFRLLFKSTEAAFDALAALILEKHPYDEPALWSLPMGQGSASFYRWIDGETGG